MPTLLLLLRTAQSLIENWLGVPPRSVLKNGVMLSIGSCCPQSSGKCRPLEPLRLFGKFYSKLSRTDQVTHCALA